jgi:hypothetical protein
MIRRALIVFALACGLLGFTAVAAQAHDNAVTGTAVCNHDTGLIDVQWTVANDYGLTEVLSNATRVQTQLNGHTLAKYGSVNAYETVAPGSGTISLKVHGTWSDRYARDDQSAGVQIPGACQQTQHVTVAASFTDQTCDNGTGTYTPGTYDAPQVAGTTLTITGDTLPGDTLTATYTPDAYDVIDGASSFTHTYPTTPTPGTCTPPPPPHHHKHHPKTRHGYIKVEVDQSCAKWGRFAGIYEHQGVKSIVKTVGPNRYRFAFHITMRKGWTIRAHDVKGAPYVTHTTAVERLKRLGHRCHKPSPGSG